MSHLYRDLDWGYLGLVTPGGIFWRLLSEGGISVVEFVGTLTITI